MVKDTEVKKKRGRKPKLEVKDEISTVSEVEKKIPKRRGRKPKNQSGNKPGKPSKKRGVKKIKEKSYGVSDGSQCSDTESKSENVILHLSVHTNDIDGASKVDETDVNCIGIPEEVETTGLKNSNVKWIGENNNQESCSDFAPFPFNKNIAPSDINNIPNSTSIPSVAPLQHLPPVNETHLDWRSNPMDANVHHVQNWNSPFPENQSVDYTSNDYREKVQSLNNERFKDIHLSSNYDYDKKIDILMRQFLEGNKRKEWPKSTPIHCFWCCHPFVTPPCALPLEYKEGTYHVYGCFCSPECAAAYNFNDFQDTEKQWERYALLNQLYRKAYGEKNLKIKLAPPRQTLQIFGGPLTINQFRRSNKSYDKSYVLNYPPLISINVQQEQVAFDSSNYTKKEPSVFIPIDQDRLSEASQNLKLKRKKPVSEAKNTLETCMNLQFK